MAKQHCCHGHELTSANTYRNPRGSLECLTCKRAAKLRWRTKHRPESRAYNLTDCNFPRIRFCKHGHALVGENLVFTTNRIRCRNCMRRVSAKSKSNPSLSESTVRRVLDNLREGRTISNMAGWAGNDYVGGKIVEPNRLKAFCVANPRLGKIINELAEKNAKQAQAWKRVSRIARPAIVRATDDIMMMIRAAVPRYLPKDHRDDVIQNIWMAVLERRLKRSEIQERASDFIGAEYKVNHNKWGPCSLDAPICVDSSVTLLDVLSTESGSGYWDPNMMASTGRRK